MLNLNGIKNIIFDLGGVIININPSLTVETFRNLFLEKYDEMEKALRLKNILENFETAAITTNNFISLLQRYQPKLSSQQIINAWNTMLLDIPHERLKLIEKIAKEYRVFLLSNTNEIHLSYIDNYMMENFQIKSMSVPFEKAYYSHKMGLRKPDFNIFKAILKDKNLIPEETLFIDDSQEHIIAAKQLNLNTYHLIKPKTIIELFNVN